jgi:spore germination cell wall hydrolase CwlJ-like protein
VILPVSAATRALVIVSILLATGLAACRSASLGAAPSPRLKALAALAGSFSAAGQARLERRMDVAALALARRLDPGRRADLAGRTPGWAVLDVATAPTLGFGPLSPEEAQAINAYLPAALEPPSPVPPFYLKASGAERDRAILCLTQAIYYEAALEPTPGQEAVAQTVLNRVRHPNFPHSICGVVYQGAQQVTGCQYSFTCDGSRQRPPMAPFWARAQAVALQALSGFVMPAIGTATAYHADYVFPRWGPTLVKIGQIGGHIFYRFPGPTGLPGAFGQRYAGEELQVSMAGPSPEALLAARAQGALAQVGGTPVDTYAYADPSAPGGVRTRVAGEVVFGRRVPTRDEIARINATLLAMEQHAPAPATPPAPPPAFSATLPIGKP